MTRYTTIEEIAEHSGKHHQTVRQALKNANVKAEKQAGIKGNRYPVPVINKFLAKQWPNVRPMALSHDLETGAAFAPASEN
jgi:hypothetical protein